MTIHEQLRQLRKAKGLTQEQVAGQIGLTRQALSSYESGRTRPDIETLMRLAEIYGTDLDGILYGQEKQKKILPWVKRAAGIIFSLLSLLTLVSSALLWTCNRFFPLTEGQVSPEDMATIEIRTKLSNAWETTDGLLLTLAALALLLLLLLLINCPGAVPRKAKLRYAAALTAALLVIPLPFGLTDPIYPLVNYLITPSFVVLRLAVFLVLDLVIEGLLRKKRMF